MARAEVYTSESTAAIAKVWLPTVQDRAAVRTAVVGVSGYAGGELTRLLLRHPRLAQTVPIFLGRPKGEHAAANSSTAPVLLEDLHPQLAGSGRHTVLPFHWQALEEHGTKLIFFATPHEQSRVWVPEALARGYRVIDLSGAWRLREAHHRSAYRFADEDARTAEEVQTGAVYGCPELDNGSIGQANLVANPGCYATSILLALAPLLRAGAVDLGQEIICDAKSGVSGAGKAPSATTHFMYAADNLSAYAVFAHRHTGELLEQLGITREQIRFTPHLLPIPRGIFSSIYLHTVPGCDADAIEEILANFYAGRSLVRVKAAGSLPQILHVAHTNFCDIGFAAESGSRRVLIVSCLDNLLKGAAGQAVQNMNCMLGWPEAEGLL